MPGHHHLGVLDGWRAISILLVLATHWLPLGPKSWQLNATAGPMGMALFFTLSGFLITRFLAQGMPIRTFAARRVARIVPLAWLAMTILAIANSADVASILSNFLFVSNLPPAHLFHGGEHLWSICVEMQFYGLAALLCVVPGRQGLRLIPILCVAVTLLRVYQGAGVSIITWQRIDEILAGGTLALIYAGWLGPLPAKCLQRLSIWPLLILLVVTSHPASGALLYFRPYVAAALVGASLYGLGPRTARVMTSRPMAYIAEISYALYVIHGVLGATWLGSGQTIERYLKRPLLFCATLGLAHLSTTWFERPISRLARRV